MAKESVEFSKGDHVIWDDENGKAQTVAGMRNCHGNGPFEVQNVLSREHITGCQNPGVHPQILVILLPHGERSFAGDWLKKA